MQITVDAIYDGESLRPQTPVNLVPNRHYSIQIDISSTEDEEQETAWDVLESIAGTYDGPEDWSVEHDHYIYGSPKRGHQDAS